MTSFHSHLFAADNEQDGINSFDLKFFTSKTKGNKHFMFDFIMRHRP